MNPEDFEERLRQQGWREVPAEWRGEILAAARRSAGASANRSQVGSAPPAGMKHWLLALFWPSPVAWGGLAAIWLVILAVNRGPLSEPQSLVHAGSRPGPELLTAWKDQERVLTEMFQRTEAPPAKHLKSGLPGPRSERRNNLLMS